AEARAPNCPELEARLRIPRLSPLAIPGILRKRVRLAERSIAHMIHYMLQRSKVVRLSCKTVCSHKVASLLDSAESPVSYSLRRRRSAARRVVHSTASGTC